MKCEFVRLAFFLAVVTWLLLLLNCDLFGTPLSVSVCNDSQ